MIKFFEGKHSFLSNFWIVPIEFEGHSYASTEHAYIAAKSLNEMFRSLIRKIPKPGKAKRESKKLLKEFGGEREDWKKINLVLMYELDFQKFSKYYNLKRLLLDTGDEYLEEGNYWHDNFYGNCYCPKCADIKGENHLGKILMKVRSELKVAS